MRGGIFFIENVTSTTFTIPFTMSGYTSTLSDAILSTPLVKCYLPNHGFNSITSIAPYSTNLALVTTLLPHGFNGNIYENIHIDNTTISGFVRLFIPSNSITDQEEIQIISGSIAGTYIAVVYASSTNYILVVDPTTSGTIIDEFVTVGVGSRTYIAETDSMPKLQGLYNMDTLTNNTYTFKVPFSGIITTTGTKGILNLENTLTCYRITDAPLSILNGLSLPIYVIDTEYMILHTGNHYWDKEYTVWLGGTDIHYYTKLNMSALQGNTSTWEPSGSLYKNVNLSGDNYIYLKSPGIGQITSVNGITNILSKIQLVMPPNNFLFNTFGESKTIFDPLITELSQMRFQLVTKTGASYSLGNLEYSFTLEFTEVQQIPEETNINSKLAV
jgi:hypothetical protein